MRTFLALDPDADASAFLRDQITQLQREVWARHVRWVDDASLHLTLRFLGDVSAAQLDELKQLLNVSATAPLSLVLTEPRYFPNPKYPRVIACMVEKNAALRALAVLCETAARAVGLAAERRDFNAHITLGRTKDNFPADSNLPSVRHSQQMACRGVTLYSSELTPRGALYNRLHEFCFAA
jgi:RNA 2',3'-cyclic 3'-phosphodiesterase